MPQITTVSESFVQLCKSRKEELGITNSLIAEKTGVSESTLTKLFNGSSKSPSLETVLPIANFLNISLNNMVVIDDSYKEGTAPVVQSVSAVSPLIDQFTKQLTESYDKQIKIKRENFDRQLKQNSEHYEKQIKIITDSYERHIQGYERILKRKNKWITTLAIAFGVIVATILVVLIYDSMHPDMGWIRYTMESMYGLGSLSDLVTI